MYFSLWKKCTFHQPSTLLAKQRKEEKKTYYDSTLITSVAQTAAIKKNIFTAFTNGCSFHYE